MSNEEITFKNKNNIKDFISDYLKINTTLTQINLWDNNIGVEGEKSIAYSLKINSTLTYIDLGFQYRR